MMFKTKSANEDDAQKRERLLRERDETLAHINRLADALRPEIEARQPALLAEAEQAHREDVESYSFECSRSGDFLSVTITRGYETSVIGKKSVSKSTTLNLGKTTEFVFTEGHVPDRNGMRRIECSLQSKSPQGHTTYYSQSDYDPYAPRKAGDGREWVCEAPYFSIQRERSLYRTTDGGYRGHHGYRESFDRPVVENHTRDAQDDTIEFRGIGIIIHAPAGMGRAVHDKILAALR